MSYKIIDGKEIADKIKSELKNEIKNLKDKPTLAVILVGKNSASEIYVKNKKIACEEVGIKSLAYILDEEDTSEGDLLNLIDQLNKDSSVNGILVQLPLPYHIKKDNVLLKINPDKDVDGFHPYNIGLLQYGKGDLIPCTPLGIIELLKRSNIEIEGKNCVVVGRSNIVGKPIASLLLKENATVTITHSKTKNLTDYIKKADILIVSVGKANFIKKEMIKEGVVIIDVGINRVNNKICGDVDFEDCKEKSSFITPVPKGVGPMTISMLMKNCLIAFNKQN